MTAGLPGAGIGGLFYLASTLLLPARSLLRRLRGQADSFAWPRQAHTVLIVAGIIGGIWMTGWLLGFIVPDEMMLRPAGGEGPRAGMPRNVIPVATFMMMAGTLAFILVAVEVAHHVQRAATIRRRRASRAR